MPGPSIIPLNSRRSPDELRAVRRRLDELLMADVRAAQERVETLCDRFALAAYAEAGIMPLREYLARDAGGEAA